MSDFRVNVIPAANDASALYRMRLPAQALAAQGVDVHVVSADEPGECHLLVIQRPLRAEVPDIIRDCHAKGLPVVVDIDDCFETVSSSNIAYKTVQPSKEHDQDWRNVRKACELAALVTTTTPALAERYGVHGRVAVLPNFIPASFLRLTGQPNDRTLVGWSGTIGTHPFDLQVTKGQVAKAVTNSRAEFGVIGPHHESAKVAEAIQISSFKAFGWKSLEQYPQAMANLDVGIVPLELTPFNDAKSWLKGLEMAALGVPFVASPTGPYKDLAALGIGELAHNPKHWYRKTLRLINDPAYREDRGNFYRDRASLLTIEANAWRWLEVWQSTLIQFHKQSLLSTRG